MLNQVVDAYLDGYKVALNLMEKIVEINGSDYKEAYQLAKELLVQYEKEKNHGS